MFIKKLFTGIAVHLKAAPFYLFISLSFYRRSPLSFYLFIRRSPLSLYLFIVLSGEALYREAFIFLSFYRTSPCPLQRGIGCA